MKEKQIIELLSQAIEEETPDLLDNILRSCNEIETIQQKGQTMDITNTITDIPFHTNQKQKTSSLLKPSIVKWATAMAAMFIIIIGYFGYQHYTVDSIIDFDVNPSIELKINRAEKVLSAIPMNEDANIILDDMNLKNVDLDIAVNAIIGSMLKNGYVNEIKNSILISVENSNKQKSDKLQQKLSQEVSSLLDAYSIGGAILSQTRSDDKNLTSLAKEHNISVGKAQLIDKLINIDSRLNFADISKLSINDINLLLTNKLTEMEGVSLNGQASSSAYIGEEKAKSIALSQKKILESSLLSLEVQLDYEDGHMIYEVEFKTADGEYEYEIDATSGVVLKEDIDLKKPSKNNENGGNNNNQNGNNNQNNNSNQTNNSNQSNNNNGNQGNGNNGNNSDYIGKGKAKSIVLDHAKLTHSDVTFTKVKLDKEDGTSVYDIEFYSGNKEYEYEIDAITGKILEYDSEVESKSPSKNSSKDKEKEQTNNSSSSAKNTDIGTSKAKSIALAHAKLKENQVKKFSIESEQDDGRKVYNIEFTYSNIEYEYEIDASTGKIIEWDSDYDEDHDNDDDHDEDDDEDDDHDED